MLDGFFLIRYFDLVITMQLFSKKNIFINYLVKKQYQQLLICLLWSPTIAIVLNQRQGDAPRPWHEPSTNCV